MIEVIEDKTKSIPKSKEEVVEVTCEECESVFKCTQEDVERYGALGIAYVTCPCCNTETPIDDFELTLTPDNLEFPTHFFHFSKESGSKERLPDDILKDVRRGIEYLRRKPEEEYWYTGGGDTFIIAKRFDGDQDFCVLVAKDFYETHIPYTERDIADSIYAEED